jgi:hypothetical protein
MWSKKWYLERNISCDVHLLNGLLETDVPWDDAVVVWAGKLRKLGFPDLNCTVTVWKMTRKSISEACAIVCQNCAVYSVISSGMTSHSKVAQCNWECIGLFRLRIQPEQFWISTGHWVWLNGTISRNLCSLCLSWWNYDTEWPVLTPSGLALVTVIDLVCKTLIFNDIVCNRTACYPQCPADKSSLLLPKITSQFYHLPILACPSLSI